MIQSHITGNKETLLHMQVIYEIVSAPMSDLWKFSGRKNMETFANWLIEQLQLVFMYSLLNLYKQLLNLHVQMDAAAKPKVFLFY